MPAAAPPARTAAPTTTVSGLPTSARSLPGAFRRCTRRCIFSQSSGGLPAVDISVSVPGDGEAVPAATAGLPAVAGEGEAGGGTPGGPGHGGTACPPAAPCPPRPHGHGTPPHSAPPPPPRP